MEERGKDWVHLTRKLFRFRRGGRVGKFGSWGKGGFKETKVKRGLVVGASKKEKSTKRGMHEGRKKSISLEKRQKKSWRKGTQGQPDKEAR